MVAPVLPNAHPTAGQMAAPVDNVAKKGTNIINVPTNAKNTGNSEGNSGRALPHNPSKPGRYDKNECKSCSSRRYQDGSNDPGVSFKMPTKINPKAVASAVKSHEMQHVFRERNKAQQEDRKVVSQSVTMHSAVCAECGKTYVSGGTTRTVTKTSLAREISKIVTNPSDEKRILDAIA